MKKFKKQCLNLFVMLAIIISLVGCNSADSLQNHVDKKENITVSTVTKTDVGTNGTLKVHYIDVGQADSILIQQNGHNMLIDAGNNADSSLVLNYLKKQGVTELEYIIGTHPHEDHIGSLDTVIDTFQINKVLMPKKTSTTKTFRDVIASIKKKNLKITIPVPGTTYKLGEASWTILGPDKNKDYTDANNYSIVCKLTYGNTSFIFTGDAEDVLENEILAQNYALKADVLKLGHHGSHSSTSINFLAKINPKYAIISCGKLNDYGHPHRETLDKLKSKNIPVYRTDECGTIVATSDGTNINFDKKSGDYRYTGTSKSTVKKSTITINNNSANSSGNSNKTVYFTPKGKSYHFDRNCKSLKRSKNVLQGILEEAINSRHSDPCNACAGGK